MNEETILYQVADGIATITLNRPHSYNAFDRRMHADLVRTLKEAEHDQAVRCVVITGVGKAFCSGQDLKDIAPDQDLGALVRERYNPLIMRLQSLAKPIVAAVNGVAAGAGASLAFACDLRIASEAATFVLAFGRIGLVPDTGATWLLPRLIGGARTAEVALVGEPVTAERAVEIGLVSRDEPADALVEEAQSLAVRLADGAPRALALTKRALEATWSHDLAEQLELEADLQGEAGATADHAEGLEAFVAKRSPRFSGE
jgi:2-(1,2-epoxy-1,2-dihydrophenyl)acetyl-CoA isomerase